MAASSDVKFSSKLSTLDQLCSRQSDFPFIVKTRDKLYSFMKLPIEKEGRVLFIEKEITVKYARIKVLPFHNDEKEIAKRGADAFNARNSYIGDEFYIPLNCPGSLKVVPYPGKRKRYATVTEIMKDNPRYLKSEGDIITITPRELQEEHGSTKCISSGTILEPSSIVHHTDGSRYMKCVDTNGMSYLLSEKLQVNFTAIRDLKDYSLKELTTSGILLPTSVQFKPGTISPNDVVIFDDNMASDALVIFSGPLEIQSVVSFSVLVAKLRDSQRRCFKTAVVQRGLCKEFHVHGVQFRSPDKKSTYIERKYGGCLGDNEFAVKSLYLLPVEENLVSWLRSPKHIHGRVQFCDSSDSDDEDYEIPEAPEPRQELPPPIPDRKPLQSQEELEDALNALHTVVLLPTAKVKDQDSVSKLKQKAKLGFGFVHEELRRFMQQKQKQKPIKVSKSLDSKKPRKLSQESEHMNRSHSVQEKPTTSGSTIYYDDAKNVYKKRPLPLIPPVHAKSKSFDEGMAHAPSNYNYIDMTGKFQEEPAIEQKPFALVRPIGQSAPQQDRDDVDKFVPNHRPAPPEPVDAHDEDEYEDCGDYLEPVFHGNQEEIENHDHPQALAEPFDAYGGDYEEYGDYLDMRGEDNDDCGDYLEPVFQENHDEPLPNSSFFSYSVKETVECLRLCGLSDLADVCEEQKLDGEFFKNTDEATLTELLALPRLGIFKLKLIYGGWRPKY